MNIIFSHVNIIAYFMIFLFGLVFCQQTQKEKQAFPTYKLTTAVSFLQGINLNRETKQKKVNTRAKDKVRKVFLNYYNLNEQQKKQILMDIHQYQLQTKFQLFTTKNMSTSFKMKETNIEISDKNKYQQEINSFILDPESNSDFVTNNIKTNNFQTLNNCNGYNKTSRNLQQTQSQDYYFQSPTLLGNKLINFSCQNE
ncbi:hypothetical protein ABPG72_008309 [Tetrahymena utriculariae]